MIRTMICLTGLLGLTLGIGNGWAQRLPVPVDNQRKIDLPGQKSAANPYITMRLHDNGYLWTVMNNNSIIGNLFRFQMPRQRLLVDCHEQQQYHRESLPFSDA
jgi:hypothetical protein